MVIDGHSGPATDTEIMAYSQFYFYKEITKMRPSHVIMNPRIEENRQKATSWLDTNLDKDKWRAEGKFNTDFVFTDREDEFKFKLAVGDLAFVTTKTQEEDK